MKKHFKLISILFIILGIISMLFLLAKGFHFIEIDNSRVLGGIVFTAILFPSIGIKLIKIK